MPRVPAWRRYLRFWRPNIVDDIDEELRFHLSERVDELIALRVSPEDAERQARAELGDLTVLRAGLEQIDTRRDRRLEWAELIGTVLDDLRLALRGLARERGWTTAAVLTIALGIGATSALFTVVNAVLLRPLPYPNSDHIASISLRDHGQDAGSVPEPSYSAWLRSSRSFDALAAYAPNRGVITIGDDLEWASGKSVTAEYFAVLGVRPAIGRTFTRDETRPGGPPVIILSEQLAQRLFATNARALGRSVTVGGSPYTVVGVMPAAASTAQHEQYWKAAQLDTTYNPNAVSWDLVIGRVRAGVGLSSVQRELDALQTRDDSMRPSSERGEAPVVMTLHDRLYGDTRPALLLLFAAVGVLLLIACVNVANLVLARAARRAKEFAVRASLGASRWRLARYLLCESLALSLSGGALGLLIPVLAVGYFVRLSPGSVAHVQGIHVDGAVLAFTLIVSIGTGLLVGLLPAIDAGHADLHQVLKDGAPSATAGRRQSRARRVLVISELATALMLLTAAGLLTKSFARVAAINPGFNPDHLLTAKIQLLVAGGSSPTVEAAMFDEIIHRVQATPGVRSAAWGEPPLGGGITVTQRVGSGAESPRMDVHRVGAGYLETVGTPVLAGRAFSEQDRSDSIKPVLINTTMARLFFSGTDPLGKPLMIGGAPRAIIGVVQDVPQRDYEAPHSPGFYELIGGADGSLLLRADGDPAALEPELRRAINAVAPRQALISFTTLDNVLADAVAPQRLSFMLLGIFAAIATILAAIGLYGIMSYVVADRTYEIGIRVALGANRGRAVGLVMGQGMALAVAGIAIGLAGSFGVVRMLRDLLYHVNVYDPAAFVAAVAILTLVALVACYVPARRAAQVDPVIALRGE